MVGPQRPTGKPSGANVMKNVPLLRRTRLARKTALKSKICLVALPKKRRGGMKRDSLDDLWSRYIRTRDKFICQWEGCQPGCEGDERTQACGRSYPTNSKGYHAAHIFGRGKGSTRLDPQDGVGLCYPHHSHADHNKKRCFHPWIAKRMGQQAFDLLQLRSNQPAKVDRVLIKIQLEALLKGLPHA